MFSCITLGTNDLLRATVFYDVVMAALGITRTRAPRSSRSGCANPLVGNGVMVAFSAPDWASVRAFHAAALASGGSSEGEPALRPQYNPDFYSAYIRDPDGNKLAAVCRGHLSDPGQR